MVMRIGDLGAPELILIVLALVLVFGASKLGELGGQLGKSVREFKKATQAEDAPTRPTAAKSATPAPAALAPPAAAAPLADYRPDRALAPSKETNAALN
jgi:sec-independent protein translocase protein TatA